MNPQKLCRGVIGGIGLSLAIFLRLQSISILEGKYLLDTDSYRFLRQAEYIIKYGSLPERDMMRWLPVGRDLTRQLSLSSYLLAYLHQFLHLFRPTMTVYQTAVYYPLVIYSLFLFVLLLFVRRVMDVNVALLTVVILSVSPSMIFRSSAGFADRDGLCLLLALTSFYFYVLASQTIRPKPRLIWYGLSGFAMMLLGLTWEGVGLFISVIVSIHFVKLILDDYTKNDFWAYLCWAIPIILGLLGLTRAYRGGANYSSPFAFVALCMPILLVFMTGFYLGVRRFPAVMNKLTFNQRLPSGGCIVIGLITLIGLLGLISAVLSDKILFFLSSLKNNFLSPLGKGRLMQTVSELADSSLISWYDIFRTFFFWVSAGTLLSLYQFCQKLQFAPWVIMASFELILITVFYNNHVPPGFLPNFSDSTSIFYFASLFGFVCLTMGVYFDTFWKRHSSHEQYRPQIDSRSLLVGCWFLFTLTSRGAVRYTFFFMPVATICGAFALVELYQWIFKDINTHGLFFLILCVILCWESYILLDWAKNPIVLGWCIAITVACAFLGIYEMIKKQYTGQALRTFSWISFLVFIIGLTSLYPPIGGYAQVSLQIAKESPVYVSTDWKAALEWMKKNLPSNAVIAAHWDYGSQINVLANKATIIDEDHYIPYWIYLFNRYVLCAQTEIEALQFLKTHGATHLVIGDNDIQQFHLRSYLGADETFDRYVVPVPLLQTLQDDNPPRVYLTPISHLNVNIEIEGKTYAPHEWYLKQMILEFEPTSDDKANTLKIKGANAVVYAEGRSFKLSLGQLYFQGEEVRVEAGSFPGGLIVFQVENGPEKDKKWGVVYLPEVGYNALAIRLYLRAIETPHFKLVYSSPNQRDNPINQGVKVWEIIYPPDLEPNPAYLETEFKSKALYRSWMLGESRVQVPQIMNE